MCHRQCLTFTIRLTHSKKPHRFVTVSYRASFYSSICHCFYASSSIAFLFRSYSSRALCVCSFTSLYICSFSSVSLCYFYASSNHFLVSSRSLLSISCIFLFFVVSSSYLFFCYSSFHLCSSPIFLNFLVPNYSLPLNLFLTVNQHHKKRLLAKKNSLHDILQNHIQLDFFSPHHLILICDYNH